MCSFAGHVRVKFRPTSRGEGDREIEGTRHRRAVDTTSSSSRRRNDNLQGPRVALVDGDMSKETFARWSGPREVLAPRALISRARYVIANCTHACCPWASCACICTTRTFSRMHPRNHRPSAIGRLSLSLSFSLSSMMRVGLTREKS